MSLSFGCSVFFYSKILGEDVDWVEVNSPKEMVVIYSSYKDKRYPKNRDASILCKTDIYGDAIVTTGSKKETLYNFFRYVFFQSLLI
jgi:hypothetical protein